MSHFLKFSAVFLVLTILLFAFFCLDISFDEDFSLEAKTCATHGRLRIHVALPQTVAEGGKTASALFRALPAQLVTPVAHIGEGVGGLLSLLHRAFLHEAEGCTAFAR